MKKTPADERPFPSHPTSMIARRTDSLEKTPKLFPGCTKLHHSAIATSVDMIGSKRYRESSEQWHHTTCAIIKSSVERTMSHPSQLSKCPSQASNQLSSKVPAASMFSSKRLSSFMRPSCPGVSWERQKQLVWTASTAMYTKYPPQQSKLYPTPQDLCATLSRAEHATLQRLAGRMVEREKTARARSGHSHI